MKTLSEERKLLESGRDYSPPTSPAAAEDPDPVGVVPEVENYMVSSDAHGLRLDQALALCSPEHSRSRLQTWIRHGQVLVDGQQVLEPRKKVFSGQKISLTFSEDEAVLSCLPEAIPLDILFEDAHLLVINKPAGLVVHPGNGNWQGTLLNALLHHLPGSVTIPRAGIVHRLDKETSGLMVVAKTLMAQTDLVRQLQARTVKREYLALVHGGLSVGGCVDAPIARHPTQRTKMAVLSGGKPAITHYEILEGLGRWTWVRCILSTGRTHQIRVHMASIGHPLVGDPVYGRSTLPAPMPFARQALHATRLGLIHPVTRESLSWDQGLPDDLAGLLEVARGSSTHVL